MRQNKLKKQGHGLEGNFYQDIRLLIEGSRQRVAVAVNAELRGAVPKSRGISAGAARQEAVAGKISGGDSLFA